MLKPLECLSVASCIKMKLLSVVHKALYVTAPACLYRIISHPFCPHIVLNDEALSELYQWELKPGSLGQYTSGQNVNAETVAAPISQTSFIGEVTLPVRVRTLRPKLMKSFTAWPNLQVLDLIFIKENMAFCKLTGLSTIIMASQVTFLKCNCFVPLLLKSSLINFNILQIHFMIFLLLVNLV